MTEPNSDDQIRRTIAAVWRIESAQIVATLTRVTGDLGVAEDLAQDALVDALKQWSQSGIPSKPGAWLTLVAKRRAIDRWRRYGKLDDRYRALARATPEIADIEWKPIEDDVLRLIFTACHPVLGRESQVALTLRTVAGLTTEEIARLLLVPVPTVQQRIVRAKVTLAAAEVTFDPPEPDEWDRRVGAVLTVIYLIFTEGYVATTGERWIRPELAHEALRLGRALVGLLPREPEVYGLLALMEFQSSRFAARVDRRGTPILLADQDRRLWDRPQINRANAALARADALGPGRANYALQAAIAQCHAMAVSVEKTDWRRIVSLYEALSQIAPGTIVELNRAVAVSMASGPAEALEIVDRLAVDKTMRGSHLIASVRGELLARLGHTSRARAELLAAAALASNDQERSVLAEKAAAL